MTALTPTELNELLALIPASFEDFETAYWAAIASEDPTPAELYYQYLSTKGFAYGDMALGVVRNNTPEGKIANLFADKVAGTVDLSFQSDDWLKVQYQLMVGDHGRRVTNAGTDLDFQEQIDNHESALGFVGVYVKAFTPFTPLSQIAEYDAAQAQALWLDIIDNGGVHDSWFVDGLKISFIADIAAHQSIPDIYQDYADQAIWYATLLGVASDLTSVELAQLDNSLGAPVTVTVEAFADFLSSIGKTAADFSDWVATVWEDAEGTVTSLADWLTGSVLPFIINAQAQGSPLVLDLDGDGIELTNLQGSDAVYWDIDQDGMAEASGWVGPDDGLLAVDLNNNGVIDSHAELFGTETRNGFLFLKDYDSNNDGYITSADQSYGNLVVWKDTDTDGVNDAGELHTLSSLGITSINLGYSATSSTIAGNDIRYTSTFTMGGNTRTIVDAWFAYDNANTVYNEDYTLDIRTLFLPTLRGYGNLPDLHIAMSKDETLLDMVSEIASADLATLFSGAFDLDGKLQTMLWQWAGVQGDDPNGRGPHLDGRDLAFLEAVMGTDFLQRGKYSDPMHDASAILRNAFNDAYNALQSRLLMQTSARDLFDELGTYDPVTDEFDGSFTLDLTALDALIGGLDLSGQALTDTWEAVLRLVDHTVGLDNLSTGDLSTLQTMIAESDPAETLTYELVIGGIYEALNIEVSGTSGDDTMYGTSGNNWIDVTQGGNDTVYAGQGYDTIVGGAGNDILLGEQDSDQIFGGAGNDQLTGGTGDDTLYGEAGSDVYYYTAGFDTIIETSGTDQIVLPEGIKTSDLRIDYDPTNPYDLNIYINDILSIRIEDHFLNADKRVESLVFDDTTTVNLVTLSTPVTGTSGNDTLTGNDYAFLPADTLNGLDGNDTLEGGDGNDLLFGGDGNDTYIVGVGHDIISDTDGSDTVVFGEGLDAEDMEAFTDASGDLKVFFNDVLTLTIQKQYEAGKGIELFQFSDSSTLDPYTLPVIGNDGNDVFYGLEAFSNDTLYGGAGNDRLYGLYGNDTLYGNDDEDSLYGGDGDDLVYGGNGDDFLNGDNQDDTLYGEAGDDVLNGGSGTDVLHGGAGNDVLNAGLGVSGQQQYIYGEDGNDVIYSNVGDVINGGAGNDVYVINGTARVTDGAGFDTIKTASITSMDGVVYTREVNTLKIQGGNNTNIYIEDFFNNGDFPVEKIVFSQNGNEYDLTAMTQQITTYGTSAGETIAGIEIGASNIDTIYAGGGNDTISASTGNDTIYGEDGDDVIDGGAGDDQLHGQSGHNVFVASAGLDTVNGGYANAYNILSFNNGTQFEDLVFERFVTAPYNLSLEHETGTFFLNGFFLGGRAAELLFDGIQSVLFTDVVVTTYGTEVAETISGAGSIVSEDDIIYGYGGNDTINAGNGNNTVYAGDGDDTVTAGSGNDYIEGYIGSDTVKGYSGSDTIYGGEGDDYLYGYDNYYSGGSTDIDTIYGGIGNDTIWGGDGNDILDGGEGNDTLQGRGGNDTYHYSGGLDTMSETGGTDTLVFASSLHVDELTFQKSGFNAKIIVSAGTDEITTDARFSSFYSSDVYKIDTLQFHDGFTLNWLYYWDSNTGLWNEGISSGDAYENTLLGQSGNDTIDALGGDDTVHGRAGDDTITGGAGNDRLHGGDGNDTLLGGADNDTIWGGDGNDTISFANSTALVAASLLTGTATGEGTDTFTGIENITGSGYGDSLTGDANANTLSGKAGDDTIAGNAGNDILEGGAGNDTLDGGDGEDTVRYSAAASGVTVNLTNGTATGGDGSDTLVSIENVIGSAYADTIYGNNTVNRIESLAGNDTIYSYAANDLIYAGDGDDFVSSAKGTDTIYGGAGNDRLFGDVSGESDAGGDFLYGEDGDDELYGADGDDTLEGGAGVDLLEGGNGADTLRGGDGVDTLKGQAGADTLYGDGGNDILYGDDGYTTGGADVLYGGAGADTLDGRIGNDTLYGGDDADSIKGSLGDDVLYGDGGNDTLYGDDDLTTVGHDTLYGGDGNDTLYGRAGNDVLNGNAGVDSVQGQDGNDILWAGEGADNLYGGSGSNTFALYNKAGNDNDLALVQDWATGSNNVIDIADLLTDYEAGVDTLSDFVNVTVGTHTTISVDRDGTGTSYGWDDVLRLQNISSFETNEDTLVTNGTLLVA